MRSKEKARGRRRYFEGNALRTPQRVQAQVAPRERRALHTGLRLYAGSEADCVRGRGALRDGEIASQARIYMGGVKAWYGGGGRCRRRRLGWAWGTAESF